ncbi:SOS response-associated peptidase family protein [Variovorax sp. PBL-E5]|uniref:SOS response-associated peptidase family protein n=1 Tax=Variovorax sp. PBL-E5 TaxID=434014 RepID=UPI0013165B4D|nr:SOS response-associated peptidase family protein [Variovorax sp. PBL-E5]VTU22364.1 hypothetical protein E5CHR_01375 [Variovorax sp. PBL-E5]
MCDSYHLLNHWRHDAGMRRLGVPQSPPPEGPAARLDCARSTWASIVRNAPLHALQIESRRWGFHRHYPGDDRAQPFKRELFIADATQVTQLPSFRAGFAWRRCLIPMSSWSERQDTDGRKALVEVSLPERPVFAVAGLYEISHDIRTGMSVDTFVVLTVTPEVFLRGARHSTPLVLEEEDYLPWLDDLEAARHLVRSKTKDGVGRTQAIKSRRAQLFG